MSYSDTGEVEFYRHPFDGGMLLRMVHNTDASSFKAVQRMTFPLEAVLERLVTRLVGTSTGYTIELFDDFGADVLDTNMSFADGNVAEMIISADLGVNRRGRVQTMGYHTLRVAANAATFGIIDLYCLDPRTVLRVR